VVREEEEVNARQERKRVMVWKVQRDACHHRPPLPTAINSSKQHNGTTTCARASTTHTPHTPHVSHLLGAQLPRLHLALHVL
jgi:hypothetical protein